MKKLFKCTYTGKIFDNELDCIESEYTNGNERQQFVNLVKEFLASIEAKYGVTVSQKSIVIYDHKENYINDRIVHWRHVTFDFMLNGVNEEYRRYSDPIGDGRWDWNITDTVESFIDDFENEFILPSQTSFTGVLEHAYSHDDDDYEGFWKLGDKQLNDVFGVLVGKKLKIEIIEE